MTLRDFLRRALSRLSPIFPDKVYLTLLFNLKEGGYRMNLGNPRTFNEKLNWLKLHDHNPLYNMLADKYEVKRYVSEKVGAQYVVPCYGVWENPKEIDFYALPDKFVLKTTHNSGGVVVCKDKSTFDISAANAFLQANVRRNYYPLGREWAYKDIKPRVLADKYIENTGRDELLDYKFWCFDGEPKYVYCTVKNSDIFENFYDIEFNPVDIDHGFRRAVPEFQKPSGYDEMLMLARKLSEGIPFVRIDFFEAGGHVYFGEFTFYDWGGLRPFANLRMDEELGHLIKI